MANKPSAVLGEFGISIDGKALTALELKGVKRLEIERGLRMADRCEIVLADPVRDWEVGVRPKHGASVEVTIPYEGAEVKMFTGGRVGRMDVVQQRGGGSFFHIIAYGPRYTLGKGSQAAAYKDSQVGVTLQDAAKDQGVKGKADSTPSRPYTLQANVANRALIEEFAARTGLVIQEEGQEIDLAPPKLEPSGLSLEYGMDLINFKVEVNTLGPVPKVHGSAHDYSKKAVWSHDASRHTGKAKGWDQAGTQIVSAWGETPWALSDLPVKSQSELERMVQAVFDDKAYQFISADGVALGLPKLKPGVVLELEGLGKRLSGAYYVTSVTHRLSSEDGYTVAFAGCRPAWGNA